MSTQPATTGRLTAHVWESRGRLCVAFTARHYPQWTEMIGDFRRTFVVPRLAHWLHGGLCWSVRPSERRRVLEFCETWSIELQEVN